MKQLVFLQLIFISAVLTRPLSANDSELRYQPQKIKICTIPFTSAGRMASFRFNYLFLVKTKKDGTIGSIKPINRKTEAALIDESKIPECIKMWTLKPEKKYLINMSLGTIFGPNVIRVSNLTDRETTEFELS